MQFVIPASHPALPGHFPGHPVVPGVVVLDQVLTAVESMHGALGALRLAQVKFLRPLLPGETAQIALDALAPDPAQRWRFCVSCGDQVVARGEIACVPAA